jgi:hypothetical protein
MNQSRNVKPDLRKLGREKTAGRQHNLLVLGVKLLGDGSLLVHGSCAPESFGGGDFGPLLLSLCSVFFALPRRKVLEEREGGESGLQICNTGEGSVRCCVSSQLDLACFLPCVPLSSVSVDFILFIIKLIILVFV